MLKMIVDVNTGAVKCGGKNTVLKANGIGSCIAAAAIDKINNVGYIAHIMLPGKSPEKYNSIKTKYAEDAVDELIKIMNENRTDLGNIEFYLVGGGNVLKDKNDIICQSNINSVNEVFKKKKLKIAKSILGGEIWRSVAVDVDLKKIFYTEGGCQNIELNVNSVCE
ncbi:chemotaxis protein CheD [Candidatus Dependentiae bacterium]|nr:chemotaxis protein CheD [Candidatus Dependentiae bacterium]